MATRKRKSQTKATVRVALFNHKGGVGKTTLTLNLAYALAELGHRVMLVDSDPQCNVTAQLVEQNVLDDLLENSDGPSGQTLWSALKPVSESLGDVTSIKPLERGESLFLLPGDIRLSDFEIELVQFWNECFQRKLKGYRGVTALSKVVGMAAQDKKIDVVFYDVGPNIGPLNRVILLDCDYFIIPAACDLFSLRALKTMGYALVSWIQEWDTISSLAPDSAELLEGRPRFLGYIPQRFRTYGGVPASTFATWITRLEKQIGNDIVAVLRRVDPELTPWSASQSRIGQVKDFSSLVSQAQGQGEALWNVHGGDQGAKDEARHTFAELAASVAERLSL